MTTTSHAPHYPALNGLRGMSIILVVLHHCRFQLEAIPSKDFRKQKIDIADCSAVILTSKNAIDHFFRICEEMKLAVSPDTKYFCISESVALYLQKFILYRKRKVFFSADGVDQTQIGLSRARVAMTSDVSMPRSYLAGLTLSTAGGSTTAPNLSLTSGAAVPTFRQPTGNARLVRDPVTGIFNYVME